MYFSRENMLKFYRRSLPFAMAQNGGGGGAGLFDNVQCFRCAEPFEVEEQIVNSGGEVWHQDCFV